MSVQTKLKHEKPLISDSVSKRCNSQNKKLNFIIEQSNRIAERRDLKFNGMISNNVYCVFPGLGKTRFTFDYNRQQHIANVIDMDFGYIFGINNLNKLSFKDQIKIFSNYLEGLQNLNKFDSVFLVNDPYIKNYDVLILPHPDDFDIAVNTIITRDGANAN